MAAASDRRWTAFYSSLPPLGAIPTARAKISSATLSPVLGVSPATAVVVAAERERCALPTGSTRRTGISDPPSSTETRVESSSPYRRRTRCRRRYGGTFIEHTTPLDSGIVANQPLDLAVKALFELAMILHPADLLRIALPNFQWRAA